MQMPEYGESYPTGVLCRPEESSVTVNKGLLATHAQMTHFQGFGSTPLPLDIAAPPGMAQTVKEMASRSWFPQLSPSQAEIWPFLWPEHRPSGVCLTSADSTWGGGASVARR